MDKRLMILVCLVLAAVFAGCYDADKVATSACEGHSGVANLSGGPKAATGVSSSGSVVTTVIDGPYFLTCKDGAAGVFGEGDQSVTFTNRPATTPKGDSK